MKMDKKKMAIYGGGLVVLGLAGYYGYMFWQKKKSATVAGVDYTPSMGSNPLAGIDFTPMSGPYYDEFDSSSDDVGTSLVDSMSGFGFEEGSADFGNEEVVEVTDDSRAMADDMGDNPFCD